MDSRTIEDIILMHSHRGMDVLRPHLPACFCEDAAKFILSWRRGTVLLATGFYVAGHAETDGPAGTVVLAAALQELGFRPVILTDENCRGFFEPKGLDVLYMPYEEDADFVRRTLQELDPAGMISVERCGHDRSGDYRNMHGESIQSHTAHVDRLFESAYGVIPTVGIGDGGNEIGMGNLADVIETELGIEPCRVRTDRLIVASVSNWGAYGLCACLEDLTGKKLLPGVEEVEEYLRLTVRLGSVDGVAEESIAGVDGYPLEVSRNVYEALEKRKIVG